MKRLLSALPFVVAVMSCDEMPTNPPPPPNPPQAFITVAEANVIGGEIKGRVNVSGCKTIAGLELQEQDTFLFNIGNPDGGTKTPVDFTLPSGAFSHLYSRRGISTSLTLKAKVTCDDGRSNASQPVGVKFFPVASRLAATVPGEQVVPDMFIAEGGIGGTPVSFIGCARTTQGGTTIVRVGTAGNVMGYTTAHPFDCTPDTYISELSTVTGTRWIMQPGQGAYALNQTLDVVKIINGNVKRIGVGANGTALMWIDEAGTQQRVAKVDPVPSTANDWQFGTSGIMNSTPVVNSGSGVVWFSSWYFVMGTPRVSQTILFKLDLNTGALLNPIPGGQAPSVTFQQTHSQAEIDIPLMPEGTFNVDGSLFMMPLHSYTNGQVISTTVVSCPTTGELCSMPQSRRWTSQTFTTSLGSVVLSKGGYVAAVGPFAVYFLDEQSGAVRNLSEVPIQPSGSNIVVGLQPGAGADFYVLTGPNFGATRSYANEIIAVDSPATGEVWRMEYGSGENYVNGVTMAIDDTGAPWLRVGIDLVKPLTNAEYRMAVGPTTP